MPIYNLLRDRRLDCRRPGLPGGLSLGLLVLLGLACSPGETSVVNPNTDRAGLFAPPETMWVSATADREHRPILATGGLSQLRLARTDAVESIAFLRFAVSLADTAGVSGANLQVRLVGGEGSGLKVEAYEVVADTTLGKWGEVADLTNKVHLLTLADTQRLASLPFQTSLDTDPSAVGDTLPVERLVQIPDSLLRRWARQPSRNDGIALLLSASSSGELRFLSRHAVPDSSVRLSYTRNDSAQVALPTADAYIYRYPELTSPPASGTEPTLTIADWPPRRAIFRFPVLDSLDHRYGSSDRVAIVRTTLHLSAVTQPDSGLGLAALAFAWDGNPADDPEVVDLVGTTNAVVLVDSLASPGLGVPLETFGVDGHVVRSLGELLTHTSMSFYSKEAVDSTRRPRLRVVYLPPLDPRWGIGGGK
jgi:hypothetical protein